MAYLLHLLQKLLEGIGELLLLFDRFWVSLTELFNQSREYPLPPFREVRDLPPPEVVSRAEWGAREPDTDVEDLELPVTAVVFHHTNTDGCNSKEECTALIRKIQNVHMDKYQWEDIGYNFLIGGDARVYEGRGWNKVGSHTDQWNEKSIGIAVVGTYEEEPPSEQVLDAIEALVNQGLKGYKYLREDYSAQGHNQLDLVWNNYVCKCPGEALFEEVKSMPHWTIGVECIEAKPIEEHERDSAPTTEFYFTSDYDTEPDWPKGYDEEIHGPNDPWNI